MNERRKKIRYDIIDNLKSVLWAGFFAVIIRTFLIEPFHIPSDSMLPGLFVGDHLFVSKLSYGYSRQSFPFSLPLVKDRILDLYKPKQGDVVVFKKIKGHADNYIKRLIGQSGDKIQMKKGILYINNVPLKREFVEKFYIVNLPYSLRNFDSVTVTTIDNKILTIINTKTLYLNGKKMPDSQYTIAYKNIKNFDGEAIELNKYKQWLPNGVSFYIIEISDNEFADNTEEFIVPPDHYFMMGDNRDMSEDSRFLDNVGYIHRRDLIGRADMLFFSNNNSVNLFEIWKWLRPIRWDRFFKLIK